MFLIYILMSLSRFHVDARTSLSYSAIFVAPCVICDNTYILGDYREEETVSNLS